MHLPYLAGTLLAGLAQASPAEVSPRQSETMLKVDMDIRKLNQRIDGFGFSEAFQRANNIVNLPEEKRAALVDLLFNKTSGAGFTILRNGIGSSPDSSLDWMNTILPQSPGSPDAEPAYVWDGNDSGQLWVAQQAVKYGVETFYADAWSAPGFMKTNGKDSGGGYLCGSPGQKCSSGDWRQAYANYLVKLVQLYADSGVNITHLGFLNEPDMSTSYASMLMDGNQAADFIKILHPTLEKNNLSDVQIACCDATGWKAQQQITRDMVAAGAEPLLGVVTGHTYSSGISGTQPTSLRVWETECSDLKGHWSTAWDSDGGAGDGLTWAMNIYTGLTTGNVSAYLWWVGTQDPATNNNNNEKLVLVDKDTYTVSKRLWAFAQYSRTVRPGAWRLDMLNDASNLKTTAFQNKDLTMAVNIINTGASATPVVISNTLIPARSAQAWVTDNTRDMDAVEVTVNPDGTVGGLSVPARSMVSLTIELASGLL